MFKTDLPPDSSWKWEVKIHEDPLPTGRYVLADDYNKLQITMNQFVLQASEDRKTLEIKLDDWHKIADLRSKEIIRLQEAEAAAMALCINHEGHIEKLTKMIHYQQLYIQYLIGGISKQEFKKRAKEFAEPLDINRAIEEAKKEKV